jgi:hypothetical protein
MNPAVGVTKILNNLQECIDIIEELNKRNDIVLPDIKGISEFIEYKKKIIEILSDEKLESIEKLAKLFEKTSDITNYKDNIKEEIETYILHHKNFLEQLKDSLDSSTQRIKKLEGDFRINWFTNWEKNENQTNTFKSIITAFSNWEYPVMEIFPGNGDMLQYALSGEPLYIVDWSNILLAKVSGQFNEYYATKRLMQYTIKDFDLSQVPQNSFGFIYALNYINFESIDALKSLANNVFKCLLPGGIYLFIYNNSDDWWSVNNAVNYYYGLVDSNDLNNALVDIGFEVQQIVRSKELNISYVIAKKPGDIEYIKNSSVLAKIIDKPKDLL